MMRIAGLLFCSPTCLFGLIPVSSAIGPTSSTRRGYAPRSWLTGLSVRRRRISVVLASSIAYTWRRWLLWDSASKFRCASAPNPPLYELSSRDLVRLRLDLPEGKGRLRMTDGR